MIALLCPTYGRPEQFRRMRESVSATSHNTIVCTSEFPEFMPTVHKWNTLAQEAMKNPAVKLFMLAADDIIFETPGWDKALLDHYNALENKIHVYSFRDSRDACGTPHPIISREYIEAAGYFLQPIFLHWFVDTWTVSIARANNCFTHLKELRLTHDKPSDHGKADETHNGIRRNKWWERDAYVNATCQHFLESEKIRLAKHISTKHHMFFRQGLAEA